MNDPHAPNPQPQGDIIPEGAMLEDASMIDRQAAFGFHLGQFIEDHLRENKLLAPMAAESIAIVFAAFITQTVKGTEASRRYHADRMLTRAFAAIKQAPQEG